MGKKYEQIGKLYVHRARVVQLGMRNGRGQCVTRNLLSKQKYNDNSQQQQRWTTTQAQVNKHNIVKIGSQLNTNITY